MRIIAGDLGGRNFRAPKGNRTHPMSDKMRGALFNMLGDLQAATILDAFAGSGALGFEATSRDAAFVTMIERDTTAQQAIAQAIKELGITKQCKLVRASANAWLSSTHEQFDIVLLDPPYDDLQFGLLKSLSKRLKNTGTLALSWPGQAEAPQLPDLTIVTFRNYGDGQLIFYHPAA